MLTDDCKTIEESYISATHSSHLRCDTREGAPRSDLDVLLASGMTPGILGGALMRLASEWDGSEKRSGTQTEAILLMGKLKSLPRTLAAIEAWAVLRGLADAKRLAHAVVAHWLAPGCEKCHGRGHELIAGTPSLGRRCKACHGTGGRKEPMGEAGRRALNLCDDCVNVARDGMRKRLRQYR